MSVFFTCTSAKSSIRKFNTISYIHIIVFLTPDLNDITKVPPGAMIYGPGIGVGGVKNRGEGGRVMSGPRICI